MADHMARSTTGRNSTIPLVSTNRRGQVGKAYWPFVERPGLLGSKGLWPFVYDEANYFDPVATAEGAQALAKGMKAQLKEFLFSWVPLMRDSFWQEILEPETRQGKFLTLLGSRGKPP